MGYTQLTINIDSNNAENLSEIFLNLGVLSVSIEDQFAGTSLEQPLFDEPGIIIEELWNNSKLIVLVDQTANIQQLTHEASNLFGNTFDYAAEKIDEQDWVRLSQSQFQPIKVTDKLYIVPSWHETPDKDAISIKLDPGLAFGTGSHPTTFMCLEWLANNVEHTNSVLDYGCGSGILAITAKKFGATTVYGVDIDEQAIISSKINASNNNTQVEFFQADDSLLAIKLLNKFDIVVANILSNPLRVLAPVLAKLCSHKLILSGILDSQQQELSDIYSQWFTVTTAKTLEGWALLECTRYVS